MIIDSIHPIRERRRARKAKASANDQPAPRTPRGARLRCRPILRKACRMSIAGTLAKSRSRLSSAPTIVTTCCPTQWKPLLRQDLPPGLLEIIVVDNSPHQARARRFAERYAGNARLSYLVEPRAGLSNARNCGAAAARGRIVAYLDDDARAGPGWARELLAPMRRMALAPVRWAVRYGQVWPRAKPDWLGPPLFGYLSIVDLGAEMRELLAGEWLAGCNISFDKTALAEAGGFRVDLGRVGAATALLSNEDLELAERIRADGKLIIYAPDAWVEHMIAPERFTERWFRRRAAWQAVSDLLSNPEQSAALSEVAVHQLSMRGRGAGFGFFWQRRRGSAVKRDMDRAYSLVILALCGGMGGRVKPRWHEWLPGWLHSAINRAQ